MTAIQMIEERMRWLRDILDITYQPALAAELQFLTKLLKQLKDETRDREVD